jgi:SAF domain
MRPLIVISDRDNVATALEALDVGQRIDIDGVVLTLGEAVAAGHKVALVRIPVGTPVVKYGSAIGVATTDIEAGTHVHTHNVASTRGRGDLQAVAPVDPQARLAEPVDDGAEPPLAATSPPFGADRGRS